MKTKDIIKQARKLAKPYCVTKGAKFRLKDMDPGDTSGLKAADKPRAKEALDTGVQVLAELQDKLYAQDRWGVLLIFQAMDAAGKDSTIRAVMHGIDPAGCYVHGFKQPSADELEHDFLWRTTLRLPSKGMIGIFPCKKECQKYTFTLDNPVMTTTLIRKGNTIVIFPEGGSSEHTARAPFLRAASTKRLPSVTRPRIATKSDPGPARRESWVTSAISIPPSPRSSAPGSRARRCSSARCARACSTSTSGRRRSAGSSRSSSRPR